jgi:hypothetical protein
VKVWIGVADMDKRALKHFDPVGISKAVKDNAGKLIAVCAAVGFFPSNYFAHVTVPFAWLLHYH